MTKTTKFQPAKLFHAVVLAGAALVNWSGPPADLVATDANNATNSNQTIAAAPGTCPPGSERPFPPCYWIK